MIKILSMARGKEFALKKLEERKRRSRTEKRAIDTEEVMYFYCIVCGCLADILELNDKSPKEFVMSAKHLKMLDG